VTIATAASRQTPLVVIATSTPRAAAAEAARLRQSGQVVYEVLGLNGCLRAAALRPDAVLLDPALPARVEGLLRAHPGTAAARVVRLPAEPARTGVGAPLPAFA
jgi:hypothetical protein